MVLTRRTLLTVSLAASASLAAPALLAVPVRAADADPRLADRSLGNADAKVTIQEFFSLTCTHCAAWSIQVFPQVDAKLIQTGMVRYVYRDFPLDRLALNAAMVARALPATRYEAFVNALLASQDRWAFARDVNSTEELYKSAALAGMPRALFDSTLADEALKTAILAAQQAGADKYKIDSTPTFVVNGVPHSGEQSYDAIARMVAAAA